MNKKCLCLYIVFFVTIIFLILNKYEFVVYILWPITFLYFVYNFFITYHYHLLCKEKDFYNKILNGDVFFVFFFSNKLDELPEPLIYKIKCLKICFLSSFIPLILLLIFAKLK